MGKKILSRRWCLNHPHCLLLVNPRSLSALWSAEAAKCHSRVLFTSQTTSACFSFSRVGCDTIRWRRCGLLLFVSDIQFMGHGIQWFLLGDDFKLNASEQQHTHTHTHTLTPIQWQTRTAIAGAERRSTIRQQMLHIQQLLKQMWLTLRIFHHRSWFDRNLRRMYCLQYRCCHRHDTSPCTGTRRHKPGGC